MFHWLRSVSLAASVAACLPAAAVCAQDAPSGADGLELLQTDVPARTVPGDERYEFPELAEVGGIEPIGTEVSSFTVGSMSNFRRAYFLDERAFVLQVPVGGRYYLGILKSASPFTGRCARRPEAMAKQGGTWILSCGGKGAPVAKLYAIAGDEQLEAVTDRLGQ